jgi:hypothetical protein
MPTAINASRAALLKNSLRKSLYLAAVAACLWPAVVNAQSWNPTASDANFNTAAGTGALPSHTSGGAANTGIGQWALNHNTAGSGNTASGLEALYFNTTGGSNTADGDAALVNNTTGDGNTASGAFALYYNTTGNNNVAVGYSALTTLDTGSNNIALGANAGKNLTSGNRNIYVGNNGPSGTENNVIRIGQVQTRTFIAGIAKTHMSGATVVIRANGQLGVVASSARYKMDIRDLANASDRLAQLRPVSYQYKTEPGVTHFGQIAEDVDKVMPERVVRDDENRPETVQYHELIPLLLQQVKAQRVQIERLTARVDKLSQARLAAK